MLLLGNGGSLFYVKNKKLFTRAMGADQEFNFYKSNYSEKDQVINYKDWTVGLNRRNNSLKFYYVFQHYGLEKLRTALREAHKGAKHLAELVISNEDIFQIFAQEYGIVCFQVKNKDGVKDNQLTKKVADKVKNIREGFCTPA